MISDPNQPESDQNPTKTDPSEQDTLAACTALLDRIEAISRRDSGAIFGLLQLVRMLAADLLATATDDESTLVRARQSFDFADRLLRLLGVDRARH